MIGDIIYGRGKPETDQTVKYYIDWIYCGDLVAAAASVIDEAKRKEN